MDEKKISNLEESRIADKDLQQVSGGKPNNDSHGHPQGLKDKPNRGVDFAHYQIFFP